MSDVINNNLFLIKEHLGILKAANNYDIHDPATGQVIMECREPNLGFFTKLLRFTDYKRMTPFDIEVRTPDGQPVVRVHRGISIFLSSVQVTDHNNRLIGIFKQKLFSVGGKFDVVDKRDNLICKLKGKILGWDFSFENNGHQMAHVSKRWMGLGKEFFTSADNYILEISDSVGDNQDIRRLILAAVMCIDMVLKE